MLYYSWKKKGEAEKMTVKELIVELEKIEDKDLDVVVYGED